MVRALYILFETYKIIIIVRALMSWLPLSYNKYLNMALRFIYSVTEPLFAPIRSLIDKAMGNRMVMIDVSPIIAYLLVNLLERVVLTSVVF